MKKVYAKPEIVFESFSMSMNLAGDCQEKITTSTEGTCAYYVPGVGNVFLEGMSSCADWEIPLKDDNYNGLCYHNPSENYDLFNS